MNCSHSVDNLYICSLLDYPCGDVLFNNKNNYRQSNEQYLPFHMHSYAVVLHAHNMKHKSHNKNPTTKRLSPKPETDTHSLNSLTPISNQYRENPTFRLQSISLPFLHQLPSSTPSYPSQDSYPPLSRVRFQALRAGNWHRSDKCNDTNRPWSQFSSAPACVRRNTPSDGSTFRPCKRASGTVSGGARTRRPHARIDMNHLSGNPHVGTPGKWLHCSWISGDRAAAPSPHGGRRGTLSSCGLGSWCTAGSWTSTSETHPIRKRCRRHRHRHGSLRIEVVLYLAWRPGLLLSAFFRELVMLWGLSVL